MSSYVHKMHLYQKPILGNGFIQSYPVYNYRHSINAMGGFDTASCDIAIRSRDEGQQFLDLYVGNRVAFYVDSPTDPIWEGFINRMTFNAGGVEYSISLDEMCNRARSLYTVAAGSTAQTAVTNDTNSQAVFGIKQEQIDLGYMGNASGVTILQQVAIAQRAYPKTSVLPSSGGSGLLHIEFLGFYHTLEWEDHRQTVAGNAQLGALVDTVIGAVVNTTTFFDNTDLTLTVANTSLIDQQTINGETKWDMLQKIAEHGNAASYYIIGITPTDYATGTRRFYYQQASTAITYTARQSDGLRIRNLYGQLVDPWRVRPDTGIRVSDMLIGWDGLGDNPTETYIKKIDYDANRQSCIYSGDDDVSVEGVFNFKRFNNALGKRLGSPRRVTS